jgi:hypothetical protein
MWSALGKVFKQLGSGIKKGVGEIGEVFGIGGDKAASELPVIGGTIGKTIPGGTPPFVATTPGTTTLGTLADLTRPALAQAPAIPAGLPVQTIGGDFQGVLPEIGRATPPAPPPTGLPEIGGPGFVGNDPTLAGAAPETKEFRRTNLLDRLRELDGKEYHKEERDEHGNVTRQAGKDRDRDWTTKDKIVSALIGWAQGGLPGGVAAATDRNFMEKLGDQNERARLLPKIENQQKIAQRDAQTENIHADNRRQDAALEDRRIARTESNQLKAKQKVVSLKRFDPNDPTHASLAKDAGLTPESLKGWDDTKDVEKQVNGTWYKLNKSTGRYEPNESLPADQAKTLTDYTVEMPSGETRTFRVTPDKAAGFATQMKALGVQVTSREREGAANRENQVRLQQLRQQMQEKVLEHQKASTERKAQIARELLELKRQYEEQ